MKITERQLRKIIFEVLGHQVGGVLVDSRVNESRFIMSDPDVSYESEDYLGARNISNALGTKLNFIEFKNHDEQVAYLREIAGPDIFISFIDVWEINDDYTSTNRSLYKTPGFSLNTYAGFNTPHGIYAYPFDKENAELFIKTGQPTLYSRFATNREYFYLIRIDVNHPNVIVFNKNMKCTNHSINYDNFYKNLVEMMRISCSYYHEELTDEYIDILYNFLTKAVQKRYHLSDISQIDLYVRLYNAAYFLAMPNLKEVISGDRNLQDRLTNSEFFAFLLNRIGMKCVIDDGSKLIHEAQPYQQHILSFGEASDFFEYIGTFRTRDKIDYEIVNWEQLDKLHEYKDKDAVINALKQLPKSVGVNELRIAKGIEKKLLLKKGDGAKGHNELIDSLLSFYLNEKNSNIVVDKDVIQVISDKILLKDIDSNKSFQSFDFYINKIITFINFIIINYKKNNENMDLGDITTDIINIIPVNLQKFIKYFGADYIENDNYDPPYISDFETLTVSNNNYKIKLDESFYDVIDYLKDDIKYSDLNQVVNRFKYLINNFFKNVSSVDTTGLGFKSTINTLQKILEDGQICQRFKYEFFINSFAENEELNIFENNVFFKILKQVYLKLSSLYNHQQIDTFKSMESHEKSMGQSPVDQYDSKVKSDNSIFNRIKKIFRFKEGYQKTKSKKLILTENELKRIILNNL